MKNVIIFLGFILMLALPVAAQNSVEVNGITFEWTIDGTYLEGTLSAPEEGWVSVGFDPTSVMQDADFIIAYVENGEVFIRDDYGNRRTSHTPDTSAGGSDDAIALGGEDSGSGTTIRFRIPLNSGDQYDHQFVNGETIPVIFASSAKDNFRSIHKRKGKTEITFRW